MSKPLSVPTWATDATYVGGAENGFDTKVASAEGPTQGWRPAAEPPAEEFNYWQNLVGQWCDWLNTFESTAHTWTAEQTFNFDLNVEGTLNADGDLNIAGTTTGDSVIATTFTAGLETQYKYGETPRPQTCEAAAVPVGTYSVGIVSSAVRWQLSGSGVVYIPLKVNPGERLKDVTVYATSANEPTLEIWQQTASASSSVPFTTSGTIVGGNKTLIVTSPAAAGSQDTFFLACTAGAGVVNFFTIVLTVDRV